MPNKLSEIRRANIRRLIPDRRGAASELSRALGYKNPSFLSQMIGPEPSRDVTENFARRVEEVLKLAPGSLDKPDFTAASAQAENPAPPDDATVALVADVIRLVGAAVEEAGVTVAPTKFADLVALAYVDSMEHGASRPEHVKRLVRLVR
jgi:hypothetical protein